MTNSEQFLECVDLPRTHAGSGREGGVSVGGSGELGCGKCCDTSSFASQTYKSCGSFKVTS